MSEEQTSTPGLSGQLELTWTNKHRRLLSDEDGGYTWVEPADHRVAEVRLLHEAATFGDPEQVNDNLLIRGDALHALTSLTEIPEYRDRYAKKVKLVYLDPPFNTGEAFEHYDDNLEHSVWLTVMRDRLLQVRELLAPDGSIWLHLDDSEMAYGKVLLDEIFGRKAFVASIVWQKRYSRENRPAVGAVHDYILVYAPTGKDAWKLVRNRVPRESAKQYRNPNRHPRGPWRVIPMTAQGFRANQMYPITTPGGAVHLPSKGRCWSTVRQGYEKLLADGRVYFGQDGNAQPGIIRYLDEDEGLVPWTWWPHEEVGHNDEAKKEILDLFPNEDAFDTPKPERLMRRIIQIATNPGDIVLDCFAGSGTTAAVAHKLGRQWVTAEWRAEVLAQFTLPRLEKVVAGQDPGGVTGETIEISDGDLPEEIDPAAVKAAAKLVSALDKHGTFSALEGITKMGAAELIRAMRAEAKTTKTLVTNWEGGGGFTVVDVAPSMFTSVNGMVFLSEWATSGFLARATAAQLGFAFQPEGPFVGRKGKTRLAVIDGLVNPDVVQVLLDRLDEGDLLEVAATSIDQDAPALLRQLRRGSRLRKIPQAILRSYQRASRLQELLTSQKDTAPGGRTISQEPVPAGSVVEQALQQQANA